MNTPTPTPPSPLADLRVSVSQFKKAERCARAYWYEYGPLQRKTPPSSSMQLGTDVHTVLENYLEGSPIPETRAGRIASAGLKHLRDPETLEVEKNVLMPIGEGGARILCRIDMVGRDTLRAYVGDHKTSSDFKWASSVWQVKNDLQLLTYAYAAYHENPPESVTVELIYYRTRGLPVSMKVSAVVEWSTVVENWKKLEGRLPALAEIRADETGESVVGNSAACGDYGGCFHCGVCPFSPENSSKSASRDNNRTGLDAPIKTQTQKPKVETMRKTTDQATKLQASLGLSRILPKGAPPQVVQPAALLKDAAAKLNGAVEINGSITPRDALAFLERLGIDGDSLNEILSLAGLDMPTHRGLTVIQKPGAEPTPEPTPELPPEPTPSNGSGAPVAGHRDAEFVASVQRLTPGPGLFASVNKDTLRALAVELLQKWPDGVAESDALEYCRGRVAENRTIGDRRWANLIDFSKFTLDDGWLRIKNPEGYTEHPQAHDREAYKWPEAVAESDEPTGAELDREAYETKTGKKAPEPEAPTGKKAPEPEAPTVEPERSGYTFTEGVTKKEGMITTGFLNDEPHVAVFVGESDIPLMIPAGVLVTTLNDGDSISRYSHELEIATAKSERSEAVHQTKEAEKALGSVAVSSRLVVLVDCLPERVEGEVLHLSDFLAPFVELVEKQQAKNYYENSKYAESEKAVLGKVLAHCHANHPEGVFLLDSRVKASHEVLNILRTLDSVTIVRALR